MADYSPEEDAARKAALHQALSYLLRLAAQKRTADRSKLDPLTRPAATSNSAVKPSMQDEFTTAQAVAQITDNGEENGQPTANDDKDSTEVPGDRQVFPCSQ